MYRSLQFFVSHFYDDDRARFGIGRWDVPQSYTYPHTRRLGSRGNLANGFSLSIENPVMSPGNSFFI